MAKAREKPRRRSDGAPADRTGGKPQWPYAAALAVAALAVAAGFFFRGGGGGDGQPPATPRKSSGRGGLHGNHHIVADDGGPAFFDPSTLSPEQRTGLLWIDPPKRALTEQKYLAAKQKARARFMDGIERREMNGTSLQAQLSCIPSRDHRWNAFIAMSKAELVPRFSKTGYQVVKIPAKLYNEVRKLAVKSVSAAVRDKYIKYGYRQLMPGVSGAESAGAWKESNGIFFREPYAPLYAAQPMSQAEDLVKAVQPLVEEFAGVPLEVTAHHGFRYYLRNNWMPFHADSVDSLIIGVNMHIYSHFDNASEPWLFETYNYETDTIDAFPLEEGEMVIYEAAGNMHGRQAPLRGDFHGSLFLHFAPLRWPYRYDDLLTQVPPGWDAPGTCDSRDESPESQWFSLGAGQVMRKIAY